MYINLSGKKNVITNIKGEEDCFNHNDNAGHEMCMSSCLCKNRGHVNLLGYFG